MYADHWLAAKKDNGKNGLKICKDIWHWSEKELCKLFNGDHVGKSLYEGIRGIGPDTLESFFRMQKSVSAVINYAVRFKTEKRFFDVMKDLSANVACRLKECGENGGMAYNVTVKLKIAVQNWKAPGKFLGHGHCWDLTRSQKVTTPVHTKEEIINLVYSICHGIMRSHCRGVKRAKSDNFEISSIRGIGIQLNNLVAYDSQENSKTKTLSQCWGRSHELGSDVVVDNGKLLNTRLQQDVSQIVKKIATSFNNKLKGRRKMEGDTTCPASTKKKIRRFFRNCETAVD